MKLTFPLINLSFLLLLTACGSDAGAEAPEGIEDTRRVLEEKRNELRELNREIRALEDTLAVLDPSYAPKTTTVAYTAVEPQSFTNYASVQATVRASESAVASPEIPGRILRMPFEEGDPIRRGQLVAVLDVEGTETQRAELETAADLARTVYERQERLWEQNIGSEIQYLQAKNNYERIQKQLQAIDVQTNKRNVYAPLSGTVDRVLMRAGESAMPGAPILSILGTNDLDIVADAPEDLLQKVNLRDRLTVRIPTLDLEFQAPVTRIGRTVDPANRTFEVEVDVPRQYIGQLKANLLAEVEVLDYAAEDLIVLPQDLIQQEVNGRRYVYTVDDSGELPVARKVYIKTGDSFDNQAVVTEGLAAGDRIVTTGARSLTDGAPLTLTRETVMLD